MAHRLLPRPPVGMPRAKIEQLYAQLKASSRNWVGGDRDVTLAGNILLRIAQQYDVVVFEAAIRNGEIPPLKLSDEEMNAIGGGSFGRSIERTVEEMLHRSKR